MDHLPPQHAGFSAQGICFGQSGMQVECDTHFSQSGEGMVCSTGSRLVGVGTGSSTQGTCGHQPPPPCMLDAVSILATPGPVLHSVPTPETTLHMSPTRDHKEQVPDLACRGAGAETSWYRYSMRHIFQALCMGLGPVSAVCGST